MSVVDVLAEAAAAASRRGAGGNRRPMTSETGAWTWAQLERLVDLRAEALAAEGVSPAAVHPVVAEVDVEGLTTLLALWRLGVTPAPLNPRLTTPELARARRELGAVAPGAQAILWTSGTSGRPRGVALGFEGLRASTEAAAERLDLDGSEVWLASLSVAHVGGLVLVVRALLTGASLVAAGGFDAGKVTMLIDRAVGLEAAGPVTHASLVPTQLLRLLESRAGTPPPSTFRCALIGGAHAPADLVERALAEGWPLALTYGMTEMTSQVATAHPDRVRAKPGSVGPPLSGVELRIGRGGEILARGATRALGYVGAAAQPLVDDEGWYHTGDLGSLDADGDLRVHGRLGDRIISGGYTIDPIEVEEAIRSHPAVLDACVVGVPNREWGETVAAVVLPASAELDLDELERALAARLIGAKRPRLWRVSRDDLPRNANGKVDRLEVRGWFAAESAELPQGS